MDVGIVSIDGLNAEINLCWPASGGARVSGAWGQMSYLSPPWLEPPSFVAPPSGARGQLPLTPSRRHVVYNGFNLTMQAIGRHEFYFRNLLRLANVDSAR
jgi:hypothetical protein